MADTSCTSSLPVYFVSLSVPCTSCECTPTANDNILATLIRPSTEILGVGTIPIKSFYPELYQDVEKDEDKWKRAVIFLYFSAFSYVFGVC